MLTHADACACVSPPVRLQLLRSQYAYFVLVKQVKLAGVLLLLPKRLQLFRCQYLYFLY